MQVLQNGAVVLCRMQYYVNTMTNTEKTLVIPVTVIGQNNGQMNDA